MSIFLIILLSIGFIVVAIAKFKVHPFITLILAAIITGFLFGLDGSTIVTKINEGFGKTLSSIGIIIAFGSIIGTFLEKSGGTTAIAKKLIKLTGESKSPLAMNLTGILVSIPVYCDSGFIILSSINKALSKKTGIPLIAFAVALSTGLYVSHVFVPPTPGPLAAAAALNADLGLVILLGICLAVISALPGYYWGMKSIKFHSLEQGGEEIKEEEINPKTGSLKLFLPILVPILLIALRSIAQYPSLPFGENIISSAIIFIGNPLIALFIGFLFSLRLVQDDNDKNTKLKWVGEALKEAGIIILITGAGGAFGNILRSSNLGELLETHFSMASVGIALPFILAAILKTAQGSSTVAIITTATIIAPLLNSLGLEGELSRALTVLAIGAGAMTISHINDSYFWVVAQFSNMNTATTLKSHTIATLLQGLTAIIILFILQLLFA